MKNKFNFRYQIYYLLLAAILFNACGKQKDGFTTTESGLKYKFIKSSNGIKPSPGDVMIMKIAYQTDFDSVIFDSRFVRDSFTVVLVEPTYTGGVEEGFAMMSPGDTAVFKVSADSVFEKTFHTTLPPYLKPGSSLLFKVSLDKIIPKNVSDSLDRVRDIELRRAEFVKIESYLKQNNMDVMPTENGAYFLASNQGSGEFPVKGDTVYVNFTGRLLDGTQFDQSTDKNAPFKIVLGKNMIITGWEECIPLMNKGAIAKMVIPSDLGYGAKAYGKLPPYSTLVYEVEVLDIKKGQ